MRHFGMTFVAWKCCWTPNSDLISDAEDPSPPLTPTVLVSGMRTFRLRHTPGWAAEATHGVAYHDSSIASSTVIHDREIASGKPDGIRCVAKKHSSVVIPGRRTRCCTVDRRLVGTADSKWACSFDEKKGRNCVGPLMAPTNLPVRGKKQGRDPFQNHEVSFSFQSEI